MGERKRNLVLLYAAQRSRARIEDYLRRAQDEIDKMRELLFEEIQREKKC